MDLVIAHAISRDYASPDGHVSWMSMEVEDVVLLRDRAVMRELRQPGEWLPLSPLPNVSTR
jgi:hypothetical protein